MKQLTENQFKNLSQELQQEIIEIEKKQFSTIQDLKERAKKILNNNIEFRPDVNRITFVGSEPDCIIRFESWEKTAGEQWGNCARDVYTLRIGRKYVYVSHYSDITDGNNYKENIFVSINFAEKIIELYETFFQAEENDKIRVASDIESLFSSVINQW
jgi:hypothetical protein